MTEIVLLALVAIWAVVLVPGWIRAFLDRGGRRTPMTAWRKQLDTLSGSTPAAGIPAPFGARVATVDRRGIYLRPRSSIPTNSREAAVRRRDVLRLLIFGVTHVGLDLALLGYLFLLNQRRKKEVLRLAQIHFLQPQVAVAGEASEGDSEQIAT